MDATPDTPPRSGPAGPGPPHGLRVGLGTMLCVVAASAALAALFARIDDVELGALMTVTVLLAGLTVGAARRCRAWEIAAQIGLTSAAFVALIGLYDLPFDSEIITLSFVLGLFAMTVTAPLLIRNAIGGSTTGWSRTVARLGRLAWNLGLNVGTIFGLLLLLEVASSGLWSGHHGARSVKSINVPINGATTDDGSFPLLTDLPAETDPPGCEGP